MPKKIFVAGPYYNAGERYTQERVALALEQAGYETFLPQRDGVSFAEVVEDFEQQGGGFEKAYAAASPVYFDYILYQQSLCQAMVATVAGTEPDSGTSSLAGIAFAAGIPVVLFTDDTRSLSPNALLDPLLAGTSKVAVARAFEEIAPLTRKAIKLRSPPLCDYKEAVERGRLFELSDDKEESKERPETELPKPERLKPERPKRREPERPEPERGCGHRPCLCRARAQ